MGQIGVYQRNVVPYYYYYYVSHHLEQTRQVVGQ